MTLAIIVYVLLTGAAVLYCILTMRDNDWEPMFTKASMGTVLVSYIPSTAILLWLLATVGLNFATVTMIVIQVVNFVMSMRNVEKFGGMVMTKVGLAVGSVAWLVLSVYFIHMLLTQ